MLAVCLRFRLADLAMDVYYMGGTQPVPVDSEYVGCTRDEKHSPSARAIEEGFLECPNMNVQVTGGQSLRSLGVLQNCHVILRNRSQGHQKPNIFLLVLSVTGVSAKILFDRGNANPKHTFAIHNLSLSGRGRRPRRQCRRPGFYKAQPEEHEKISRCLFQSVCCPCVWSGAGIQKKLSREMVERKPRRKTASELSLRARTCAVY